MHFKHFALVDLMQVVYETKIENRCSPTLQMGKLRPREEQSNAPSHTAIWPVVWAELLLTAFRLPMDCLPGWTFQGAM